MNFTSSGSTGKHAGFRRHDQQAAVGYQIARGTQTVAVERGADHAAIRERNSGGAIPGLHQRGVIFVKRFLIRMHGAIAIPGFGNQHRHDVRQAAAGQREHFHRVVERGRVASTGCDDRKYLLQVVAVKLGREHLLARVHPVHVAAHGVDFAVVTEIAVRMRELPGGKRVGGKALVHQAERAHCVRIGQLIVELDDLRSQQ